MYFSNKMKLTGVKYVAILLNFGIQIFFLIIVYIHATYKCSPLKMLIKQFKFTISKKIPSRELHDLHIAPFVSKVSIIEYLPKVKRHERVIL